MPPASPTLAPEGTFGLKTDPFLLMLVSQICGAVKRMLENIGARQCAAPLAHSNIRGILGRPLLGGSWSWEARGEREEPLM